MEKISKHDLSLPRFGPYGKEYIGISHIANSEIGLRFDMDLFFGIYRQKTIIPDIIYDNGVKSFKASPDLKNFAYRYELEWKDLVYCDVSAIYQDDENRLIKCDFVNNTDMFQSLNLNVFMSIHYPKINRRLRALVPSYYTGSGNYINAVDYNDIKCSQKIAQDGLYLGEKRESGFSGDKSSGISKDFFGKAMGQYLTYNIKHFDFDTIYIRYRLNSNSHFFAVLSVDEIKKDISFEPQSNFSLLRVNIGSTKNKNELKLECLDNFGIDIDSFVLCNKNDICEFVNASLEYVPEVEIQNNSMTLKYKNVENDYTITWDFEDYEIRSFHGDNFQNEIVNSIHNHVDKKFVFGGSANHQNLFLRPISISPNSKKTIRILLSANGNKNLDNLNENPVFFEFCNNKSGTKYKFSQEIMAANTLMNVVYPIYCDRNFVRHATPGRIWDSLYTWDSGFIGLGLCSIDYTRAYDNLNAYLTEVDCIHSNFIFHGSVVPTQIFLYKQLFEKYQNIDLVKEFYPRMKWYYSFFSNLPHEDGQTKSHISKTWHIFYNSGGWDDYPPQDYLRNNPQYYSNTTPVITSAITIICAKIMLQMARLLNFIEDEELYLNDIEDFKNALLKYSWDEDSGYFGYVVHDENGDAKEILRYKDGTNFNMGLDGIYPLLSGICDEQKNNIMINHIKENMMTEYGISTVALNAPYYRNDGYWNGAVWMPHQFIIWKSCLDLNKTDLASEISEKSLNLWKKETEATYNCYEHFLVESGRGAGYHQFSGLSAPVLSWFDSYYVKGNITSGFFTTVKNTIWNADFSSVSFECESLNENYTLLLCLNENYEYTSFFKNEEFPMKKFCNGTYYLQLNTDGKIEVLKK